MKSTSKIALILFFINLSFNSFAQRILCKNGYTSFFSKTPVEDIQAENNKVYALLDVPTNNIAIKITITDFSFPNKLMQEHFNENYMESEKFPTSVFSGKIDQDIDYTKDGSYDVTCTGKLIMHGVSQPRKLEGKLTIKGSTITIESNFIVKLVDHKIDVPSVVVAKIAEEISVKNKFVFTK